jgi:hypothetical protein
MPKAMQCGRKKQGGAGRDQGVGITIDASGNSYVTGGVSNNATFGSTTLSTDSLSQVIFIAKYDAAGNAVWVKKSEGSSETFGNEIAVDGRGNCYVTGSFVANPTFGSTILSTVGREMFIAKLRNCALPVAICKNITVQLDASGHASITAQNIDNGSSAACGIQSLTLDVTEFSCANVGPNTVTLTVTDSKDNATICQATVTVLDNTAPIITCPANTFVQFGNDESPVANGTAIATDNCAGVSVGTPSDVIVNGQGNNKKITRTWTATDVAKNTATCNQTITVCDMSVSLGNDRNVFFGIPGFPGAAAITATISGGLTGVTYLWSSTDPSVNGSTTQSVTPTGYSDGQVFTYTVTATAPSGCTVTTSVKTTYININCSNNGNTVKVKVCKITPGNPTNCNSLCVSMNAYQALLDNGSYLGNCLPNCVAPPQQKGIPAIKTNMVGKQYLDVKVLNNPSYTFFSLYVYGDLNQKVSLRVIDMHGRVFDQRNNLSTKQEIRLGDSYAAGVYMVEVMQGENRKVVKLVKQ